MVDISVVVPSYKPGKHILTDISQKKLVLDKMGVSYELIYYLDGLVESSEKESFEMAKSFALQNNTDTKRIVIDGGEVNMGKGYAVHMGVGHSTGLLVGFIDYLNDIDPRFIEVFYKRFKDTGADIISSNKFHDDPNIKSGTERQKSSIFFLNYVRLLTGVDLPDTQTGIKFFKGNALREVLPKLTVNSFAFDIEIIVAMLRSGHSNISVVPVEVNLENSEKIGHKSTVNYKRIIKTFLDVLKIAFDSRVLKKYTKKI